MSTSSVKRTKGAQKPSKYPIAVGQRYKIWGEQPGFVYNPYQDQYIPDLEAQKTALQGTGALPADPTAPTPPSLTSQILPTLGAGLLNSGTKAIGDALPGLINGTGGGLFGIGGGTTGTPGVPSIIPGGLSEGATALGPSGGGLFSIGGIGSAGNGFLPAAGAAGAFDLFSHKRGVGRGALQGAASGAALGSYFGPTGAVVGAGAGGLIGLGKGIMDRGYSNLEDQKRNELAAKGIQVGSGDGAWENNSDFAQNRDESKLKGQDILDAADWRLKFGDRWDQTDRNRQIEIANEAIKRGAIREHNGGIDINTSLLNDFVKPMA